MKKTPNKGDENRPVILAFPRKRGRPRSRRIGKDTGTPELVMKRLKGETSEALDLCLERGLITPKQHWCGIHFRWLYTLRYGAPGIRAIDPTHLGGVETKLDDPDWRAAREKEFNDAIKFLDRKGYGKFIMNLCIYNERPKFLAPQREWSAQSAAAAMRMLRDICEGLDLLADHWER